MTTNDELTGTDPEEPRKKGGGDGSAKSATGEGGSAEAPEEGRAPGDDEEAGAHSRKITTPRG